MRKLKLQMQVTLDGFNSTGPNDEQGWVTWDLDGIKQYEFKRNIKILIFASISIMPK